MIVVVDALDINKAHSGNIYLNYSEKSWDSLNFSMVMIDSHNRVNTEEKVKLFVLVKKLDKQKDIIIIIIFNKLYKSEDREVMDFGDKVHQEVQNKFGVSNIKSP